MSAPTLKHTTYFSGKNNTKGIECFSGDELDYMIDFIERFNLYAAEHISITAPNSDDVSVSPHDITQLQIFTQKPVFRITLNAGGRIFTKGGYQNISAASREHCLINGENISGIDTTSSALQFLKIIEGEIGIDLKNTLDLGKNIDPYDAIQKDIESKISGTLLTREVVKKCVIGLIYPSEKDKNLSLQERREGNVKNALKDSPKSSQILDYLLGSLLQIITTLESNFNGAIHIQIWKAEAQFLYAVLEEIMLRKLHTLPMHDGFLCPKSEADTTREVLDIVSNQRYQKSLHFHEGF